MNVHEYQAKELLRGYGVPVAQGAPAFTVEEAVAAAQKLPGPVWVVKAQIHAGGRGKGKFKEADAGDKGGVRIAKSIDEVKTFAAADAGQDAGDAADRAGRPRRQAPLHRGRLRHRPRALSLRAGRPRHLAHLLHRLHRRRHGHREGGARHARQDRHAVDRSGVGLRALPRPQDRLGPQARGRPDRPMRQADRPALCAPSSRRTWRCSRSTRSS